MEVADRLVLALDGSTRACSAALLGRRAPAAAADSARGAGPRADGAGWEVVARRSEKDGRGQARVLLALVDEMLAEVGSGAGDLGAVVVGTGPGTFTGVRIAVATGRALALALAVPVLGVSTLAALAVSGALAVGGAAGPAGSPSLLVPVVDARRGQVFFGVYEAIDETGGTPGDEDASMRRWARQSAFGVCDRGELGTVLTRPALVVAEDPALVSGLPAKAVLVTADVQAERLVVSQWLLEEPEEAPAGRRLEPWLSQVACGGAAGAGMWGLEAEREDAARPGDVGTPESVKPIYVRSPDADIHITKMRDPWAAPPLRRDLPGGR